MRQQIDQLISNFDEKQLELLAEIVVCIATVKSEAWTGKALLELNANEGHFCDALINMPRKFKIGRKKH